MAAVLTWGLQGQAVAAHAPTPHRIIVATLPGALQTAQTESLWRPYSHNTGATIRPIGWDGTLATIRQRLRNHRRDWSLALIEDSIESIGCDQGLFLRKKPTDADPGPAAHGASTEACGTHALSLDIALAWDQSRFQGTPGWSDFWDVARRPGKRGLRCDPRGTLEIALLSDGVAPADIYRVLSTSEGLTRAFKRLSQLRPYVVWWNTPAEAAHILTSGAALMGSAPTAEIITATQAPTPATKGHGARSAKTTPQQLGILWSPRLRMDYDWVVPSGTAQNIADALALEQWMAEPAQQDAFTARYPGTPPSVSGSTDAAGSAIATAQANDAAPPPLSISTAFWHEHLTAIEARFDQWLAQH